MPWRFRLLDCLHFGPAYNLSDPVLVINTVNSAGEIFKALWSCYGSRLSRQSWSGVALYAKYHVVIICLLGSLANLMVIGTEWYPFHIQSTENCSPFLNLKN